MTFKSSTYIVIAAYLLFAFIWVIQFNTRIEPWLRKRIARMLDVQISRNINSRGVIFWNVRGSQTAGKGCLIKVCELMVTEGIGLGIIFLGLFITGLIIFKIYF